MKNFLAVLAVFAFFALLGLGSAFVDWLLTIEWMTFVLVPVAFAFMGFLLWLALKAMAGDFNE